MKLALLLLAACTPSASADQAVYAKLVAGGCLAPSVGGVAAVAAEHVSPNPAWLACLYDGGSVQGCGVPCDGGRP